MGRLSKRKGKTGEREVAALLRALGLDARRTAQYRAAPDAPDVLLGQLWIEVKRRERVDVRRVVLEAAAAAGDRIPVVFSRANRRPWTVTLLAKDIREVVAIVSDLLRQSERHAECRASAGDSKSG